MLNRIRKPLSGLTRIDWAWLHFKAALGLLWIIPLTQIAYLKTSTSPWFIVAWGAVTTIGFFVSVTGLIMSAQKYETRRNGFRVEMAGLWLMMAAPAVYGLIQIGFLVTHRSDRWIALAFAYIICSALIPRMVMIKGAARSRTVIYRYREPVSSEAADTPTTMAAQMNDLYYVILAAPPADPEPTYWGIPISLLIPVVGLAGAVIAALITAFSKKWRTPADDREDKKIGIEADERLLSRFEALLESRDQKIKDLENRLTEVANKVESLITERNVLIDWIYAAVRVVRELGAVHLLPKPPKGVYIADHPSTEARQEQDAST